MKVTIVNKQKIKSSVNKTIDAILDCEEWPRFIPTVRKVQIIEKNGNYAKRILHSEINGVIVKMLTETYYYPQKNEIYYNQIQTPWPLVCNSGTWKVNIINTNEVELVLTHIFKVKYSVFGYLFGLLIIGPFFIYFHNRKDLKLYKKYLEKHV